MMKRNLMLIVMVMEVSQVGCSSSPVSHRAPSDPSLNRDVTALSARVERLKNQQRHLLVPGAFARVAAALHNAKEAAAENDSARLSEAFADADRWFPQIEKIDPTVIEMLNPVLQARAAAYQAGASLHPSTRKGFQEADVAFQKMGSAVEAGDWGEGSLRREGLQQSYAALEVQAVQDRVLSPARKMEEDARDANAKRYAPKAFESAQRRLQEAVQQVALHPREPVLYQKAVNDAEFAFKRVAAIMDAVAWMTRSTPEDVAIWMEARLDEIRRALGSQDVRDRPLGEQASLIKGRAVAASTPQATFPPSGTRSALGPGKPKDK